jgi:hypothetical protein
MCACTFVDGVEGGVKVGPPEGEDIDIRAGKNEKEVDAWASDINPK